MNENMIWTADGTQTATVSAMYGAAQAIADEVGARHCGLRRADGKPLTEQVLWRCPELEREHPKQFLAALRDLIRRRYPNEDEETERLLKRFDALAAGVGNVSGDEISEEAGQVKARADRYFADQAAKREAEEAKEEEEEEEPAETGYHVRYYTGAGDFEADSLEEAKREADAHAAYTQSDIGIADARGREVLRRTWWGYEYNDETDNCEDPICFGSYGFYGDWTEV